MDLPALDPHSPEVLARVQEFIRSMTPEQLMDFMEAGAKGLEQTDMTGHFPINPSCPILDKGDEAETSA